MLVRLVAGILTGGALGGVVGHFGSCASGTCPLTSTPLRGALYGAVMGVAFMLATWTPANGPPPG